MIDLYQILRDLNAMRSNHSGNVAITKRVNKLPGKPVHLREPENPAQAARLKRLITKKMSELAELIIANEAR